MSRPVMPAPSEPPEDLAALLRRGPSSNAMRQVTGSDAPATLLRAHFSNRRPLQLVYAQNGHTILAEYHAEAVGQEADTLRRNLAKGRRGLRSVLDEGAVVADPEAGLVLRRPGLDTRLPGLRLLHDPHEARAFISRIEGQDPGPATATLVSHRLGKRAVIRLSAADGRTRYARLRTDKSGSGQTAFSRHRAVWDLVRSDPMLGLPEPLGENAGLGAALFAELPGAPPVFAGLGGFSACQAIAKALRRLQSLPLGDLPTHDGAAEARLLQEWVERLHSVLPDRAIGLRPSISQVCGALKACPGPHVPCHRDMHEKQILIDGSRAGLLDFDTLSLGDPAMDAGNLMAHLFLAGVTADCRRPAFETEIAFAFRHLSGRRLRLWRRAALLRLSMIYAFTDMNPTHLKALQAEAMAPHD